MIPYFNLRLCYALYACSMTCSAVVILHRNAMVTKLAIAGEFSVFACVLNTKNRTSCEKFQSIGDQILTT